MFEHALAAFACAQSGFRPLEFGDIGQRNAYHGGVSVFFQAQRVKLDMQALSIAACDIQFTGLFFVLLLNVHEMPIPAVMVFWRKELGKTPAQQLAAHLSQHCRAGEVDLGDQGLVAEGEVTDGSEVIEIDIAVAGFFQHDAGLPQSFVLHFQLDLVHLKFMLHIAEWRHRGNRRSREGELRLDCGAEQLRLVLFFAQVGCSRIERNRVRSGQRILCER